MTTPSSGATLVLVSIYHDYTIIRGYPGTGKSVSVVALVQVLVLMGKSVLLTAYTHSAVDNILLKLKAKGVDFLRLGRRSRIHPELHGYADEILTSSFTDVTQLADFYASKAVVATTCLAVNHVLFSKRRFDVCIVDEAAQVLLPACTAPLLCADKFVLVGDSQQLPPVVQSTQARSMGLTETVFSILERGGNQDCCSSLTLQYRMAAPIMRLANAITYNGQLQCASDALQDARLHLPYFQETKVTGLPDWLRTAVQPEQSVLLLDTAGSACEQECSLGIQNTGELHITAAIVATLLQLGVLGVDIGVIAPYRAQVRLLQESLTQKTRDFITSRQIEITDQKNEDKNSGHLLASDDADTSDGTVPYNEIKNSCRDGVDSVKRVDCKEPITTQKVLEESKKVEINTVDQYQGRDKLVIIYSCVRSCTDPKKAGELLRDERRLNVALTRAQRKLIVIGNVKTLMMYEPLDKLVSVLGEEQIIKMDAQDGWQSCFSKSSS
ncbi:DNA replication ATP-dependent helicase/nuclease DNA2 [Hyalella azteca]|uniref:DNA replication ATP-dependent helicase/nuclease n=1 Tax=Hyalella azteca TaxID=294128 RepID=A0A8B7N617_HYAAZ|nr:DNA replication ATP-dependent helicase/nuclease DNA2 [Hyalella azteca]